MKALLPTTSLESGSEREILASVPLDITFNSFTRKERLPEGFL